MEKKMKTIITMAILLSSTISMAAAALSKDDVAIYPAKVSLSSVQITTPSCPPNALCEPMSVANVVITLSGCADKVGTVSYNVRRNDEGKLDLNISAIAIRSKKSASIKCFAAPMESRQIILEGGTFQVPEVNLNDLNVGQN
jgi:hypothetical protein